MNLKNIYKSFKIGTQRVPILKDINLKLYSGEFAIIYGPSGCGKSTLLHIILGLEEPTRGIVELREKNYNDLTPDQLTNFRREKVGTVFQKSEWIKSFNVWENVAYPLYLSGIREKEAKKRALEVLEEVGMAQYATRRPTELSGGQQQRVAMARALSSEPWIIIADEPTGNLDTAAAADIMQMLALLNRSKQRMILMVTHDVSYLPLATRRIGMVDGKIVVDDVDDKAIIDYQIAQKAGADSGTMYLP